MKISFNRLLRWRYESPLPVRKWNCTACLIIIRSDYTIRANNHRCVYVRVYVRQVFDGNPVPCRKKRVNDYGAAPEAAQWNGSMDEPPVASLTNQLPAQGTFDNLCCTRCTRAHAFYPRFTDSSADCEIRTAFFPRRRKVSPGCCFASVLPYYPSNDVACIISECSISDLALLAVNSIKVYAHYNQHGHAACSYFWNGCTCFRYVYLRYSITYSF